MKIENIQIAYQLFIDLNEIEDSKKQIQKIAEILVENKDTDNDFSLCVEVKTTNIEEQGENKTRFVGLFHQQSDAYKWVQEQTKKLNDEIENVNFRISQKVSLQMLGLMLSELNEKESIILQELKRIGVTRKTK